MHNLLHHTSLNQNWAPEAREIFKLWSARYAKLIGVTADAPRAIPLEKLGALLDRTRLG